MKSQKLKSELSRRSFNNQGGTQMENKVVPFNAYGSMKKEELIRELNKRDNQVKAQEEWLDMAAKDNETLFKAKEFALNIIGGLTFIITQQTEQEVVYLSREAMFDLNQKCFVDFNDVEEMSGLEISLKNRESISEEEVSEE
jgi:hypothetical protein